MYLGPFLVVLAFCSTATGFLYTKSVELACPGQQIVFHCEQPRFMQTWLLRSARGDVNQYFFARDSRVGSFNYISGTPWFGQTVNYGQNNNGSLVSEVIVSASRELDRAEFVCSNVVLHLYVVAPLPSPSNFHELYHHLIINSSIAIFSWDMLTPAQLSRNFLNSYLVSIPSLSVNISVSDTVISLLLPANSTNITIFLSSCNCAGCGSPTSLTWTTATASLARDFASCYVPVGKEVSVDCDQHLYSIRTGSDSSSARFVCSDLPSTAEINITDMMTTITSSVNTSYQDSRGVQAIIYVGGVLLLALLVVVGILIACILKLRLRNPRLRQTQAVNPLEQSESTRYAIQPPVVRLGPLPSMPSSPLYDVVKNQVAVSRIDLSNNDAYTCDDGQYYT